MKKNKNKIKNGIMQIIWKVIQPPRALQVYQIRIFSEDIFPQQEQDMDEQKQTEKNISEFIWKTVLAVEHEKKKIYTF